MKGALRLIAKPLRIDSMLIVVLTLHLPALAAQTPSQ
jgi:hypothetical protein